MRLEVKPIGFDDAVRRLNAVNDSVEARNIERVLLIHGARPIRDEWKRRAPRGETSNLIKGIVAKIARRRGKFMAAVLAATNAPHSHLVLLGAKPHEIKAKTAKVLRFAGRFAKSVHHPGAKPNNFTEEGLAALQPQLDADIPAALKTLIEEAVVK